MGDPGPRDIRQTLARPGQNPPHAPSRHHGDASGIPSRLVFNYADVMARGAPRPQAHPGEPRQVIRHADRHIRDASGATTARTPAATADSVHLPRHSGISALYGRRVLERQAQQASKDLRPTRMGAAGGLTGAGPPAESASQISSSNWSPLSRRALNRKPCPRISTRNGMSFPIERSTGKHIPESALKMGRTFRSRYSNASVQAASLKPGIAKSSPTSSGRLTSMPSVANSS